MKHNIQQDILAYVSRETLARFEAYAALLERWNRRINLVSPGDIPFLWERHILDAVQLVPLVEAGGGAHLLDLGSGGGLPGLVLAMALPGLRVTLVESDQRKAAFLREAARCAGVAVTVLAERIERARPPVADVVSARALAPLPVLVGYAFGFLGPGGYALFPKGKNYEAELVAARKEWHIKTSEIASRTNPEGRILRLEDIRPLQDMSERSHV